MPHRQFAMSYAVLLDGPDQDEPILCGPFGDIANAREFAEQFCKTSDRVTDCEVRPLVPPIFVCDQVLGEGVG